MTDGSGGVSALPPPNWYPDPSDSSKERWWSGEGWTEHTRDVAPVIPVYASMAAVQEELQPVVRAQTLAYDPADPYGSFSGYTSSSPTQVTGASGYTPMSRSTSYSSADSRSAADIVGSPDTVGVWLIAFYPIISVILFGIARAVPVDASLVAAIVAVLVSLTLVISAVVTDYLTLKRRGIRSASPIWILLTLLAYMIARRVFLGRVGLRHSLPLIVFIVAAIVGGGATTAISTLPNPALNDAAVQGLETEIETTFQQDDPSWEVTCPRGIDVSTAGVTVLCSAVDGAGHQVEIEAKTIAAQTFRIEAVNQLP